MKCGKFCFNSAVFRKSLSRFWPAAALYCLCWSLVLILMVLNSGSDYTSIALSDSILESLYPLIPVSGFLYGPLLALLLFSFVTKSTSCNAFLALPLKRSELFGSVWLAGIVHILLPQAAACLLMLLAEAVGGSVWLPGIGYVLALNFLTCLFFYSLAVFCFMISGHIIFAPVLYLILNFTAYIISLSVSDLLNSFVWGQYIEGDSLLAEALSPIVMLLSRLSFESIMDTDWQVTGIVFHGWGYLAGLTGCGILLSIVSCLLFRVRRAEAAGDAIAFRGLRPVFKYAFTAGCALVIGVILSAFLQDSASFPAVLLCLFLGAVIGYLAASMILQKTVRIFRLKNMYGLAASLLVIFAALGCVKLDLFGFSVRLPEAGDVASASLSTLAVYDAETDDPTLISRILNVNQQIAESQDTLDSDHDTLRTENFSVAYTLKNGGTIQRQYTCYLGEQELQSRLAADWLSLADDKDLITADLLPCRTDSSIRLYDASLNIWETDGSYNTSIQISDMDGLTEAILADIADGALGRSDGEMTLEPVDSCNFNCELYLDFGPKDEDANTGWQTSWISVNSACSHLMAFLSEETGVTFDMENGLIMTD